MQTMTYTVAAHVARIPLDRPERGNGLTRRLIDELAACVERADLDPEVHVILLAGNGKGFCGGYDLVDSAEGLGGGGRGGAAPAGSALGPAGMAAQPHPRAAGGAGVDPREKGPHGP